MGLEASKKLPVSNRVKKKQSAKDTLWMEVKNTLDVGLTLRRPFEMQWTINLAFLSGKQYSFFNTISHSLVNLKRSPGQIRSIDNKILPKWRRQVSDLIKNRPQMSVVPNTRDEEDVKAAKLGDRVLKSFWRTAKMQRKIRQLGGWIFGVGNGFLDDRWDSKAGPISLDPEEGTLNYMGDVVCSVWSPFEVVVPGGAFFDEDLHDMPWMIKTKQKPLDWVKSNYPNTKDLVAEDLSSFIPTLEVINARHHGGRDDIPQVRLINFYLKPNQKHPKGLFIVAANGQILEKLDYPFNHYFLSHFKDIDIPGMFWGKATLEEAIRPQRTWNATLTSIEEYNRMMGKGKWISPKGAQLQQNPDDSHGQMLEYVPILGLKPEMVDLKGLPTTYPLILQLIDKSMQDLFSQHEITQGTNKSDIRSGEMVALLREQDAHGAIPTHAVFEEALEETASRVLKRIQFGYTEERIIQVRGDDGEYEIESFKGADLRNNTDVSVKQQSSLPDSRIARESTILNRFSTGLYGNINDQEVRREVLNKLDDAIVEGLPGDVRQDEQISRWENQILASGNVDVYLINDYDNHPVHVDEHNDYRKQLDYQKLRLSDPEQFAISEAAFIQHDQMHQKFIAAAREQEIQLQIALSGGGGDSGPKKNSR